MKYKLLSAAAVVVVALSAVLIGTASAAKPPPPPAVANGCPNGGTFAIDPDVGASAMGMMIRTYTFSSWVGRNPVGGVPGLIGYCVYTNTSPSKVMAVYPGWKASKANRTFSFTRPSGDKTNIPLDGTQNITVGTATFGMPVSGETIVLHVNDAARCRTLYPGSTSSTCFVLPGPKPGPVCDGPGPTTGVGYTSLPKDVTDCSPPSEAFEAQQAKEFGDEVILNTTTGHITSLTVDFQSYGCSDSGHWYSGTTDPCVTTPGATFTHDITANIYAKSVVGTVPPSIVPTRLPGALLGTVTQTFTDIPFRPSADPVNCPNPGGGATAGSQWFNPASGACLNSISKLLTFNFAGSGIAVPSDGQVIWTVKFNTTDYGDNPLGHATTCFSSDQGCGYDSLNVGTMTYTGAPYVGTDVDPSGVFLSSTWTDAYCDSGAGGTDALRLDTGCWGGFTPLGQVNVGA